MLVEAVNLWHQWLLSLLNLRIDLAANLGDLPDGPDDSLCPRHLHRLLVLEMMIEIIFPISLPRKVV
jgi:hypothetical protein